MKYLYFNIRTQIDFDSRNINTLLERVEDLRSFFISFRAGEQDKNDVKDESLHAQP
jgi:hypothetical protein